MKKRLLVFAISCLVLCSCGTAPMEPPAAVEEPMVQAEPADPETGSEPAEPEIVAVEMEVRLPPQWRGSEPQHGEPIVPQPGDTALTWDPERADSYPADEVCSTAELLEKWLAVEGLTESDLEARNCEQLILVVADGVEMISVCYSRQRDGTWIAEPGLEGMAGYVGSRGIAHDRRRSSLQSPAGLWPLGSAFGLEEEPDGLKVPWRDITDRSDWVCDDDSLYFNTWQERDDPTLADDWNRNDTEHLADYDETYTYACIIEYNTPPYVVPNRGCAIFLHVSDHPTEGCVGLLTEDMVRVLQWLDPHRNPHILISGYEK